MSPHQHQNQNAKKLRIAVMGDIHVHDTARGSYEHVFAEITPLADVLVLCGDITHTGAPKEAEHLAHDLQSCRIPVLAVLGNHDHHSDKVDDIKNILKDKIIFLEDETYTLNDIGFAGTKGFGGGFDSYMLAHFGEKEAKEYVNAAINEALGLENDLQSLATQKIVVALHYSPIEATVVGEPKEIMPFLGCSRLAETIDRFNVSMIFHGHAHHGTYEGKTLKGIPVYNCATEVLSKKFKKPYSIFEI